MAGLTLASARRSRIFLEAGYMAWVRQSLGVIRLDSTNVSHPSSSSPDCAAMIATRLDPDGWLLGTDLWLCGALVANELDPRVPDIRETRPACSPARKGHTT